MHGHLQIPTAWLSIADQVTVLLMIPVLDSIIYPYLRKNFKSFFCENNRLILGMAFSAISAIAAGFLETYRIGMILDDPKKNTVIQIIDNTTYVASNLYVEWQIPQYTLVGLGEVFCSVSCNYYNIYLIF
jgi:dipeptide/tripeptide permease